MIEIVEDIPEDYELIQIDRDIDDMLDYIGYKEESSFTVLYAKLDKSGADIETVYGCYGIPYLSSSVYKIFQKDETN